MSEIEITGLAKSFGPLRVLRRLDLLVPDHALAAVLGPSGCGKTTLLRLIAGFEAADGGSITIGGEIVDDGRRTCLPKPAGSATSPRKGPSSRISVGTEVGFGLARGARAEPTIARRSSSSASPGSSTGAPTSSRAVSSSASRWPGHSRRNWVS